MGGEIVEECLECRRKRAKANGWRIECYKCGRTFEVVGVGKGIVYCDDCEAEPKEGKHGLFRCPKCGKTKLVLPDLTLPRL